MELSKSFKRGVNSGECVAHVVKVSHQLLEVLVHLGVWALKAHKEIIHLII